MKIAQITPGLYVDNSNWSSHYHLVLDGGKLYAKPSSPTGVVTIAPTKRYNYNGSSGVLTLGVEDTRPRQRTQLAGLPQLDELIQAIPEILRLATTVSVEAAQALAKDIAGKDFVIQTTINPTNISPANRLIENPIVREAESVAQDLRDHGISSGVRNTFGAEHPVIRVDLTPEQARAVLKVLTNKE